MSEEENKKDFGTITIKKENIWKYSTIILAGLLIFGAFIYFGNNSSNGAGSVVKNGDRVEIEIGNSPVIGNADAPVTVVEFTDFSCPFCAAASGDNQELIDYMKSRSSSWEPIVTNLMEDYVDTGKVKFVLKYFPGHGSGQQAHLIGWCLNEQDLFWEFQSKAFEDYENTNDLTKMRLAAESVGADMTKLQSCLDSKKYEGQFATEQSQAQKAGVSGTPAFFVNGQLVEGAVPYSQIKQIVDAELAK